jgi:hypothetical protein
MDEFVRTRELLSEYFEVLDEHDALGSRLKRIKEEITTLVQSTETKKIGYDFLGTAQWVEKKGSYSYDTDKVDAIMHEALRNGDIETANALAHAQKKVAGSGSLRITKSKA